jgi:hypothetical protein
MRGAFTPAALERDRELRAARIRNKNTKNQPAKGPAAAKDALEQPTCAAACQLDELTDRCTCFPLRHVVCARDSSAGCAADLAVGCFFAFGEGSARHSGLCLACLALPLAPSQFKRPTKNARANMNT